MGRLRASIVAAGLCLAASPAYSAELLTPKALQADWFDGRTISTTGPRGGVSTFIFSADGKLKRTGGRTGSATDGSWRLDDDGFCMTLGSARREGCYLAIKADSGALKVVRRSGGAFTWSR